MLNPLRLFQRSQASGTSRRNTTTIKRSSDDTSSKVSRRKASLTGKVTPSS